MRRSGFDWQDTNEFPMSRASLLIRRSVQEDFLFVILHAQRVGTCFPFRATRAGAQLPGVAALMG
jgi:hypothetical protein